MIEKKTEIEAKFLCADALDFDALLGVVDILGFRYLKEEPRLQADIYLDTPQYTLLHSGSAFRIRQRGESYTGAYKVACKQNGAIFERKEFEWILSHDEIRLWNEEKKPTIPPAIMNELDLRGQTLRKVLVAETNRSAGIITSNDGFKVELSLDDVTFRGHRGQKKYREIEIELLDGQFEQFQALTQRLQNHFSLQPAADSKYKQGMVLVGKYGTSPA